MKKGIQKTILTIAGVGVALSTVIATQMINTEKNYPILVEESSITSEELEKILRNRDFRI